MQGKQKKDRTKPIYLMNRETKISRPSRHFLVDRDLFK